MATDAPEAEVLDNAPPVDAPEPTIRESILAAREELTAEPVEEPTGGPERDENGRFKPKAAAEDAPPPEAPLETEPAAEAPPEPAMPAPASWSSEAKAKWAEVPKEVQAEFAKRETEVRQLAGRMDGERQFARSMSEVIRPYEGAMRQGNIQPVQYIGELLNTAYTLNAGDAQTKARMLATIADQYGIDMDAAYQFRGQAQPVQAPMQPPVDINAQVDAAIEARELRRETDAFFANPANVHADAVRDHMAALLGGGVATTLQDAYDQAIYARPDLRSTLIAADVAKAAAQQAASHRVAQAKQAAVSLPGSSGSPRPPVTQTSLRDELRNGLREMTSAA